MRTFPTFHKTALTATLSFMAFGETFAQNSEKSRPERVIITRPSAQKPSGMTLDVELGGGQFQDLQAPVAVSGDRRVDGTTTVQDSSTHLGPMLGIWLGWQSAHSMGSSYVRGGGLRIANATGSSSTGSTYARAGLILGSLWDAKFLWPGFKLMTEAEARRSMFRNVDTGHYADSFLARGGFKQDFQQVSLNLSGAVAPVTKFGYSQSASGSGALGDTTSQLSEWGGAIAYSPTSDASFSLGISQENIYARVNDIRAYKSLGLAVDDSPDQASSRIYNLSTTKVAVTLVSKF